ncbi:glutamate--tRNA ligase [Ruminococcaceae bacterium OttesenSCG-928-N02]|nr:glutamate--tRNA ligase [Ruminococcaceae bacterium OttesenSCG-928-N02]
MKDVRVRTRFAPSPTGYMHVGNLRTALYAYLTARANGGDFLLRIEDTDQTREVEGAIEIIYNTLTETNLLWDEGPDVGGPYGPYVQSERKPIYKKYAEELVEKGAAYYCFCTKERLEELNKAQKLAGQITKYDRHCVDIPLDEAKARVAAGEAYVIRQRIPDTGVAGFDDINFGHIEVDVSTLDDQVLLKADGLPTYNFANVVDDHLMKINPVIRGTEYLSSAPKYNLLYDAFGWEVPDYVHCPPVMKDATHKLSKRNGDASYEDLVAMGYLTPAILNYIALLGWSSGTEQEIFSLEEMVQVFDVERINKSPSIFDTEKLRFINGEYIRAFSKEEFYEVAMPWIEKAVKTDCDKRLLSELLQQRCEVLGDIPEQLDFIDALPDYDIELFTSKKMKTTPETAKDALVKLQGVLEGLTDFEQETVHDAVFALIEKEGVKNGYILWPLRVAVSGKQFTPGGGVELAVVLGKAETLRRVQLALEKLA